MKHAMRGERFFASVVELLSSLLLFHPKVVGQKVLMQDCSLATKKGSWTQEGFKRKRNDEDNLLSVPLGAKQFVNRKP